MASDGGRRKYLLDGKRVGVHDLLEAGLLEPGECLTFARSRSGETHLGVVEKSGHILVEGRSYATPSSAASATIGGGSIDGWTAWATSAKKLLHTLRLQLLDGVAAEASAHSTSDKEDEEDEEEQETFLPRHTFLKEARSAAERGEPKAATVRDLVRMWNAFSRSSEVSRRISVDLENHGLITRPDFLSVSLEDEVVLDAVGMDPAPTSTVEDTLVIDESFTVTKTAAAAPVRHEIGMTLGNLVKPWRALEWVKPTATVEEALTKMLINDYSQLPVLKTRHNLVGAVTWQSIARARLKDPEAPLGHAVVPAAKLAYSDDLHTVLPRLQNEDFIVVTNPHNEITGIVTTADVVALYHERTLPFLLIGELDQELRHLLEVRIPLDVVRKVCSRSDQPDLTSFDDMTMGDYQQVLSNQECWTMFTWPLDRITFIKRIDELRVIRNDITHFNPDPAPDDTVDKLRHMLDVIRRFGPAAEA